MSELANPICGSEDKAQTPPFTLGKVTSANVWKVQGWGLVGLVFLSFFPTLFHLEEYVFFPLLLVAVVVAWKAGDSVWVRSPIDLPIVLFAGWILLTIPFAIDPVYSFGEWRKVVAQVLVFYWASLVLRRHHNGLLTQRLLATIAVATTLLCAYAAVDFLERGGTWRDRSVRAGALHSDYNWLTTYIVMALPMLVATLVCTYTVLKRITAVGAILLTFFSQAMSYTRAGWIGMVAQGIFFGVLSARRRLAVWVLAGGVLLGAGLLALSQMGYQRDTLDPWTLNARLAVWKLALAEVVEHPLVGIGYGSDTFMKRFAGYPGTVGANGPHSLYVMVVMGSGIPAVACLGWILIGSVRALVQLARRNVDARGYAVALAVAVMIVGFAVRNLFDYMFAGSLAYLFWILVATGFAQSNALRKGV